MLNKDLQKAVEFIIEEKPSRVTGDCNEVKPVQFSITPDSLQNVKIVSAR